MVDPQWCYSKIHKPLELKHQLFESLGNHVLAQSAIASLCGISAKEITSKAMDNH